MTFQFQRAVAGHRLHLMTQPVEEDEEGLEEHVVQAACVGGPTHNRVGLVWRRPGVEVGEYMPQPYDDDFLTALVAHCAPDVHDSDLLAALQVLVLLGGDVFTLVDEHARQQG